MVHFLFVTSTNLNGSVHVFTALLRNLMTRLCPRVVYVIRNLSILQRSQVLIVGFATLAFFMYNFQKTQMNEYLNISTLIFLTRRPMLFYSFKVIRSHNLIISLAYLNLPLIFNWIAVEFGQTC